MEDYKMRVLEEFAEKFKDIWERAMEKQAKSEDEALEKAKQKYVEAGEPENVHYMDYYEQPEDVWQDEIEKELRKIAEIEYGEIDYCSTTLVNYKGIRIGIVFDDASSDDDGHTFVGYSLGLVLPKVNVPEDASVIAVRGKEILYFKEVETHVGDSVGFNVPEVNVDLALKILQKGDDYVIAMPLESFEVHGKRAVRLEGKLGLYPLYTTYELIERANIPKEVIF